MDTFENFDNSLELYYYENTEKLQMKNHFHNSYEIIYIVEGIAEFKINDKTYTCSKGDILFISNLETHELKVIGYPYKRYFFLIKPKHLQLLISHPILASIFKYRPEHYKHVISIHNNEQIIGLIKKMYIEYIKKEAFWESMLSASLNSLFVLLYREYKEFFPLSVLNRSTNMVLEIQKYIDQHYTEEISLDAVSKMFYSDMYYISHLFKKVTGFTFKEYIILLRISKAKDLLFYTDADVTTVGLDSGFNSVNHFIRIFKKYEGITPYQYRKMSVE